MLIRRAEVENYKALLRDLKAEEPGIQAITLTLADEFWHLVCIANSGQV